MHNGAAYGDGTMGRPKAVLVLDAELREQLESLANSRSLPAGLVRRAKIILLSASGKTNRKIARRLDSLSKPFSDDSSTLYFTLARNR